MKPSGEKPMPTTISALEVFSFALALHAGPPRQTVMVKLSASDGSIGWGEAGPDPRECPETRESILSTLGRHFAPAVLHRPLSDIDGLHRAMDDAIAPLYGPSMPLARGAIDLAAHDALARSLKVGVRGLLGQQRLDSVRLSWKVTGTTVSEVEASLQSARSRGHRNFDLDLSGNPDWDLRLVKTVCDSFPGGTVIAHGRGLLPEHEALGRIEMLADVGLNVIEDPLSAERIDACAQLVQRSPIPIALDRAITGPGMLMSHIAHRALSAATMKVTRMGGLLPARRCTEIAQSAGVMLLAGGMCDAGVGFAAGVQFAAAMGITTPACLCGAEMLKEDVVSVGLQREGDLVSISPERAGLGVEVDEEKVRALAGRVGGTYHRIG
jgi:muconate cycloisomerase